MIHDEVVTLGYDNFLRVVRPIFTLNSHNILQTCSRYLSPKCGHVAKLTVIVKRLKGALDARIAEEQARQRASAQASPSRSAAAPKRSNSRNLSPAKKPVKGKDADTSGKAAPSGKGPDPSEFDPEFVIGEDEEQPSRSGTPRPKEKADTSDTTLDDSKEKEKEGDSQVVAADDKTSTAPEIAPDVQVRLRKLDKLEPKYTGK